MGFSSYGDISLDVPLPLPLAIACCFYGNVLESMAY